MKKLLLIGFLLLYFAVSAQAQCTISPPVAFSYGNSGLIKKSMMVTCVAGVGGTVEAKSIDVNQFQLKGFYLLSVETSYGATAPTDQYSIVVNNDMGVDLLTGRGANRTSSTPQLAMPSAFAPIFGNLNQVITGNSQEGAVFYIRYGFIIE